MLVIWSDHEFVWSLEYNKLGPKEKEQKTGHCTKLPFGTVQINLDLDTLGPSINYVVSEGEEGVAPKTIYYIDPT